MPSRQVPWALAVVCALLAGFWWWQATHSPVRIDGRPAELTAGTPPCPNQGEASEATQQLELAGRPPRWFRELARVCGVEVVPPPAQTYPEWMGQPPGATAPDVTAPPRTAPAAPGG